MELDLFGELADENIDVGMELAFDNLDDPQNREGHAVIHGLHECNNRWY